MNTIKEQQCNLNENEQETILPFSLNVKEKVASRSYGNEDLFKKLADEFRAAKVVNGTAREFINFSISFRQNDDYVTACEILKKGLNFYTNDIELLACYLYCILDGGMHQEIAANSKEVYEKIRQNPLEDYSEYVFNSVLNYLVKEKSRSNEPEKIRSEAETILNEFYKQHPNSEGSYLAHSELFIEREKKKDKLRAAVRKLSSCPRCDLKLAEMFCEDGEYEKALNLIEKCLRSVQPLSTVKKGYVYYLRGICEYGIFQDAEKRKINRDFAGISRFLTFLKKERVDRELKNKEDMKSEVQNIYESFRIARNECFDLKSDYRKEIEGIIYVLERQTGVYYS